MIGILGDFTKGGPSVEPLTQEENSKIMRSLIKEWSLGPDKASARPGENAEFWSKISDVWGIPEEDARRRLCANCEYFDNRPDSMKVMESVPFNRFDADGGGRGYCHNFDFICHNLRTCQAWEEKEFELEDSE